MTGDFASKFLMAMHWYLKSHVSNGLGKLHLADRPQAAAFAWRDGGVRR